MSGPHFTVRRHSPSCGCEGDVADCYSMATVSVALDDLTGADVAQLPASQREDVLDALCCELELQADGSWELVDSDNVEECPTCNGIGGSFGVTYLNEVDHYEHHEMCDDCRGTGWLRARPTRPSEADYELGSVGELGVGGSAERLIGTTPVAELLAKAEGATRATVRPVVMVEHKEVA